MTGFMHDYYRLRYLLSALVEEGQIAQAEADYDLVMLQLINKTKNRVVLVNGSSYGKIESAGDYYATAKRGQYVGD